MSEQPAPTTVTGAQSLIKSLEAAGAENVFGIPGGAILPAYDPLMDSVKLRHILVRHEQGAGHAAQGYAVATGKVGVCMATSGPGATNLVTPLADAHMDSVPLVAITVLFPWEGNPAHPRLPGMAPATPFLRGTPPPRPGRCQERSCDGSPPHGRLRRP